MDFGTFKRLSRGKDLYTITVRVGRRQFQCVVFAKNAADAKLDYQLRHQEGRVVSARLTKGGVCFGR